MAICYGFSWNCDINFTMSIYASEALDAANRRVTMEMEASVFARIVRWMDGRANLVTRGLNLQLMITVNGIYSICFGKELLLHSRS